MPYKCTQGHVTSMLDLCARCFVDDPNYKNLPISTLKGLPIHNDLFGYNDFYAMVDQLGPPSTWDPPIINKQIWFRWHPPWSSSIKLRKMPLFPSNTCISQY